MRMRLQKQFAVSWAFSLASDSPDTEAKFRSVDKKGRALPGPQMRGTGGNHI